MEERAEPKSKKMRLVYPQTSGKVTTKTCRVPGCSKLMLLQNYSTHLKMKHPQEDSKDLRGKKEQNIQNLFQIKRNKIVVVSDINDNVVKNDNRNNLKPSDTPEDDVEIGLSQTKEDLAKDEAVQGQEGGQSDAVEGEAEAVGEGHTGQGSWREEIVEINSDLGQDPEDDIFEIGEGSSEAEYSTIKPKPGSDPEKDELVYVNDLKRKENIWDDDSKPSKEATEVDNLLVKLAPLARLEDETINKMVENLEALARLSLKERVGEVENEHFKEDGNQESGQNNSF